jgi:hypothetical protein
MQAVKAVSHGVSHRVARMPAPEPLATDLMRPESISRRYALLRAEIQRRMVASEKWSSLPVLLDELHQLRQQYVAARRSLDCLTEESERLAFRKALH